MVKGGTNAGRNSNVDLVSDTYKGESSLLGQVGDRSNGRDDYNPQVVVY